MIFVKLFLTFLKIGAFTFGGGYAMLPLIQEEVVANEWMDISKLIDFIAVSESTPGPFAVNIATYVGSEVGGFFGSVCATTGVVLPSFVIILALAKCYDRFKNSRIVIGCMSGLKPAVVGLICAAAVSIAAEVLFPSGISATVFTDFSFYVSVCITALSLCLAFKKVHPIFIICVSAVLGIITGYLL